MKKLLTLILCGALGIITLTGCSGPQATPKTGQADNEIITYTAIDPQKTTIWVSTLGTNAYIGVLRDAFMEKNPDVQMIVLDLTGGDVNYRPALQWVKKGIGPDVMFLNSNTFSSDAQITEMYENLSASPAVANYSAESLNRVAIDGNIYLLPGPSTVSCMLYNKTLFQQYGWQIPTTFDEFVALCERIREDTQGAVQPWNPNAKYDSVFSVAMEAFCYEELFGGVENYAWYDGFCAGKATFAGHMEPMYEMIQTLIDHGILLEEHFTYSATTRGEDFANGKLAIFNGPASFTTNNEYEYDMMPFPTTQGQLGYVNDSYTTLIGVTKKEHTDKQRDAIDRFIAFLSTAEGQQALIGTKLMVSNVKGVSLSDAEGMAGISEAVSRGHMFEQLTFQGEGLPSWTFRENALAMLTGEKTAAQCIAAIDEEPFVHAGEAEASPVLATVTEDMTILETSCFYADVYREKAGADIGLINHNVAYRGNLIRLFEGELPQSYVEVIKPRSFENKSTLVKLSMTGQQLMDALNHPKGNNAVSNSLYAYSGLKCKLAPGSPWARNICR